MSNKSGVTPVTTPIAVIPLESADKVSEWLITLANKAQSEASNANSGTTPEVGKGDDSSQQNEKTTTANGSDGNGGVWGYLFLNDKGKPSWIKILMWGLGFLLLGVFAITSLVSTKGTTANDKDAKEAVLFHSAAPILAPLVKQVPESTPNTMPNVVPPQAVSSEILQKPLRSPYRTTFETATMSSCDVVESTPGNAQVFVRGLKAGPGCAWVEVSYPFDVFMVEGVGFTIEFPYQKDILGVASCANDSCVRYLNHVKKSPEVKEKRVLVRVKKDTGNSSYPEGFVKIL